jgi:NADH-quinone oxidoreductase subunit K
MQMPTVLMQPIPMEHGLLLAAILFARGLIGVLTRRNMVFVPLLPSLWLAPAGVKRMARSCS